MSQGWDGGSDTRWRRFRAAILARDRYTCKIASAVCTGRATDVDHIVPLHMGGPKYDPANCRAAPAPCNQGRRRATVREEPSPRRISTW